MSKETTRRPEGKSRRAFLRDAGITLAGATVLAADKSLSAERSGIARDETKAQSKPAAAGRAIPEAGPSKRLILENKQVRFEFDAVHMGLVGMTSRDSGINHVHSAGSQYSLWELALARGTQVERVTNSYKPCDQATIETLPDGLQRLTMRWKEMRWWLEDKILNLDVRVDLPAESGIARWHIAVENLSDYWGLWSVAFPIVDGFPHSGTYDVARPNFGSGGELMKSLSEPVVGTHPSGFWSMQFAALNAGLNGVYVGTQDPDGRGKEFIFKPGIGTRIIHYPENMAVAGSGYPGYYATELGVYQGGWIDAAKHYRNWAVNQKWLQRGRLSQREDVPAIIKDAALWLTEGFIWNPKPGQTPKGMGYITHHGAIEMPTETNAPYIEAQKKTGVPMGLHWYNWYQSEFNHNFPAFLPPRISDFKERVRELVDAGWLVMPYINGVSVDLDLPEFKRFESSALTDQAGGYDMGFYGDSAGRLLQMCPSQRIWQQAIYEQARGLYDSYGVNGLYVDQVSAVGFLPCFNPTHGHPIGGGRSWADGYRDLLGGLKGISGGDSRPLAITSESMNEIFLDKVDANLTWGPPTHSEIPLMEAVYSGFTLFFASPCDYSKSISYFRHVQGHALMDGRQNGWVDVGLFEPEYADRAEYFGKCGLYRGVAKKFLTYGELLGALEFDHPAPSFKLDDEQTSVASVDGRLWLSEDGHLGVIMANFCNDTVTVTFRLDPAMWGLKSARYALSEVKPTGATGLGAGQGMLRREQQLSPGQIVLIELAPQK